MLSVRPLTEPAGSSYWDVLSGADQKSAPGRANWYRLPLRPSPAPAVPAALLANDRYPVRSENHSWGVFTLSRMMRALSLPALHSLTSRTVLLVPFNTFLIILFYNDRQRLIGCKPIHHHPEYRDYKIWGAFVKCFHRLRENSKDLVPIVVGNGRCQGKMGRNDGGYAVFSGC